MKKSTIVKKNNYFLLLLLVLFSFPSIAQLQWSRVKVYGNQQELQQLAHLGLPTDHGEYKAGHYFMTDLSNEDIAKLEANGYAYEIIIEDVQAYYVEQNQNAQNTQQYKDNHCPTVAGNSFDPTTPSNFQLGTMGGFYKYQEFLDELDSMRSKYPNLISDKAPIGTFTTIDGNPIYWLRISDNPDVDENEEEVLYTSIHHAREPASLSQTIFYMWYMLENYGTDPEVTYLIDNTEMYFVPMINPDGYRYNELTNPNGGGMHRKNRRNVGTSNKGVDLNRNYGYHWDESGTSPNPNNDTYAGSGEFSETETQAMRWFVEQHSFKFAFNAHTHGNLLLYPIGWSSVEVAPHEDYFDRYSAHMVKYNGYSNIKSSGLYPAAGDSDDWMYIDDIGVNGKDTIFALTPEVSSEGTSNDFWPPSSSIENICKNTVHMNMVLAHMPHVFGVTSDLESNKIDDMTGYFSYELERLGLTDGAMTVSMTPVTGIQSLGTGNTHNLSLMEIVEDSIQYTLDPAIQFGDDIIYVLETDNGTWVREDTIYKTFGSGTQVFYDDGATTANWSGDWSFTNEDFVSPSNCITDSPFVNYGNNQTDIMELNQTIDLGNATYGYVTFWAKWEIEDNWDYVQFQISTDGGTNWTSLCGKYTNYGGPNQDLDEPLYDGFQNNWVQEEIDLTDYLGQNGVQFRFLLISDGGVTEDGYYFDDFSVYTDGFDDSGIDQFTADDLLLYPNPAQNELTIAYDSNIVMDHIEIKNELGQVVMRMNPTSSQFTIDASSLSDGIYFLTAYSADRGNVTERFAIVR